MPAKVIITEDRTAAISVEGLKSGNFEISVESKRVFDENKIDRVSPVITRAKLIEIRDAINSALGE